MPKIILMLSLSLDGFFEGPDQDLSWSLVDEELHQHFNDECNALAGYLEGRVTHELMADFWPTADQDPDVSPVMAEYAGIWREKPKFVFSRTLTSVPWSTEVISDVVPEHIEELKARMGGDLAVGGPNLAASFMRHGLIDEYRLYIHPVVIGKGKRLFQLPDQVLNLEFAGTRTFGNGVVQLRYVPKK
ncbi:dihydrofolate reductase family protein [Pseudarthrobacter sp. J64]|uniref:dihydrofolate reductase family protein n=1 Tax=Pseudarthrobacter sp. J64 TaxID=3116485 RepID=UPI002E80E57E|nr:dihydrofolate reductase family protein [Pseudarthrobacter sp. J64]MEE2568749.1 dihydrofolate reductase family protein [Pseudarthrobacter sp. J64]